MLPMFVYRCFDAAGVLLYVGQTKDLRARFWTHKSRSPWWPELASTTVEEFTGAFAASLANRAEQTAIATEAPKYNVYHQSRTERDKVAV